MKSPLPAMRIFLATSLAALCFGQTAAPVSAPVPTHILYDAFFFRVVWFDQMAQQREAKGQDGSMLRSAIRREAGLEPDEEQVLKVIAADCQAKIAAMATAARAAALAGSKGDPQSNSNQRKQIVLDHIGQLQSRLSPAAVLTLDLYVRGTVNVRTSGASAN